MITDTQLRKVAVALYDHLNTPVSSLCKAAVTEGRWRDLASMAVSPSDYKTSEEFRKDYQAVSFLKKSQCLQVPGETPKSAALASFFESEARCRSTNDLLRDMLAPGRVETRVRGRLRSILNDAAKIIKRVLGPLPDDIKPSFGPGTCTEMKGSAFKTLADKMWVQPTCSASALDLFEHYFWPSSWGRTRMQLGLPLPAVNDGSNRFTTVPKTALTDRGICIEPLGNLWLQLGVGYYLKRRLALVGLGVSPKEALSVIPAENFYRQGRRRLPWIDGQSVHRDLARDGSVFDSWATIDLSCASDTVSYELVRWLLPPDWFVLMDSLRATHTEVTVDETTTKVELSKFSSMGNGFTFELETLIFAAISAAVSGLRVGHTVFAYGDDIIVPPDAAREVSAALEACGFVLNRSKSYSAGPFRESCGGDYFLGSDVRPVFSKSRMESPMDWVALHNSLRAKWPGATLALKRCVEAVPVRFRCFGPPRLGDVVFHSDDPSQYRPWRKDGCEWVATLNPMPVRFPLSRWGTEFTCTLALMGVKSKGIEPRGLPAGMAFSKASIS